MRLSEVLTLHACPCRVLFARTTRRALIMVRLIFTATMKTSFVYLADDHAVRLLKELQTLASFDTPHAPMKGPIRVHHAKSAMLNYVSFSQLSECHATKKNALGRQAEPNAHSSCFFCLNKPRCKCLRDKKKSNNTPRNQNRRTRTAINKCWSQPRHPSSCTRTERPPERP